jgi:hypothetical protein
MFSLALANGEGGFGPGPFNFTHDQVPFRSMPRYLRLDDTLARATDYAAGGFHVSVDRGRVGGCFDDWKIHSGGTKRVACSAPRANPESTKMWSDAASKYLLAFEQAKGGSALSVVKGTLQQANQLADTAYSAEGLIPPRDPVTNTVEPPVTGMSLRDKIGIVGLSAGLFALTAWGVNRNSEMSSGGSLMGARRRHRSRR